MTSPPGVRLRLSRRLSRQFKGNLKPKAEVVPLEKNVLVNAKSLSSDTDIEDPPQSDAPAVHRRPSKRPSLIPVLKGKADTEEVESLKKISFVKAEPEDPIPEIAIHRRQSKRPSIDIKGGSRVRENELAQENISGDTDLENLLPITQRRRSTSMRFSRDTNGKAEEPILEEKRLFNDSKIGNSDKVYMTTWNVKEKNFVSYAHGQEVMRGDEWGFIYESRLPESSTSAHRFQQVKQSIARSTKTVALKVEQAAQATHFSIGKASQKGKEKEDSVNSQHSPCVVYGDKATKMDRVIEKSEILTDLVDSIKKLNIFKKDSPHRVWDRRQEEDDPFTSIPYEDVLKWTAALITDYNEHKLVALTTQQLNELQGKSVDVIIYANPVYKVPNASPVMSQCDEEEWELREQGDLGVWDQLEDQDLEAENEYIHKDLRKLLGVYRGFHIASGTGSPETFVEPNNLSDYYDLPLVETGRNHRLGMLGTADYAEQEHQEAMAEDSGDYDYENRDEYTVVSSASSDCDQTQTVSFHPRSQLPGQALILYLMYGGHSIQGMAKLLGGLEEKFLYETDSHWWKGFRIPQHTQLTDLIVGKIIEVTQAPKEWWEEEFDPIGSVTMAGCRIPPELRLMKTRMRERRLLHFAMKSIENYLWWRFLGEQPYPDVKSGPMMRVGEYHKRIG